MPLYFLHQYFLYYMPHFSFCFSYTHLFICLCVFVRVLKTDIVHVWWLGKRWGNQLFHFIQPTLRYLSIDTFNIFCDIIQRISIFRCAEYDNVGSTRVEGFMVVLEFIVWFLKSDNSTTNTFIFSMKLQV